MQTDESVAGRAMMALSHHHLSTADIVERLNGAAPEDTAAMLVALAPVRQVAALDRPEFHNAAAVLATLPAGRAADLIAAMSADRAADVLAAFEAAGRDAILARLAAPARVNLQALLGYRHDTAGGMMTTEFVAIGEGASVAETLDHIRTVERSRETVYAIYVLAADGRLRTTVSLRQLITADPAAPIVSLATGRAPVVVSPDTDREAVAHAIRRHDLLAVPVVDGRGHILGIVTVDDVLDAIVAESTEDVQKFGGVEALDGPYLQIRFGTMIRKRAGWLSVLFLSEMLTASAMQHFEAELERALVLILFIPLIMSSGGNSGSQATSLLIRALALGQIRLRDWWRVVLRELPTGITLGLILGTIGIARIVAWQYLGFYDYGPHWILVAATVGAGLVGIVTFGSLAGSMLPFALQRIGFDPASASAPFVATLVDVTGLVIYFSVAALILRGTLL